MSYHSKSIKQIVEDIEFSKAYLPAIQRKFVWPRWKIEYLFDSLMRNFPIGSFLFWELKSEKAYEYVFYNFLKNYDERKPNNERKIGSFLHPEIIGVLDGQQRLSSLYLGLQGSHRERLKYHKSLEDRAYPETFMYLNLLSLPYQEKESDSGKIIDIERESNFEFKFLTYEEASRVERKNEDHELEYCYWFKAGTVLRWSEDADIDNEFDKVLETLTDENQIEKFIEQKRFIKKAFRDLHKRTVDQLINYFKVTKDDLDDILQIFIRVNSGGTILSKTDLLFSTIVATWEDGRDEIEAFLRELNGKGDGFWFNNDFLMRCCLVLSDLPVLFKVNSFKSENVQLIKDNWADIKLSLNKTVDLISSYGFNGSVLTSQNAIIIIAYHYMKGGNNTEASKQGMRKYLLHSSLKNVYGGQGDQVISSFRNALRKEEKEGSKTFILKNVNFPIDEFLELKLPASKSLKITSEDIDDFMQYRKGANAFFVLSLLYPHLRYNEIHFHQDHIHPDSRFSDAKLKAAEIAQDNWIPWQQIKDTMPNLQLMEGRQNESKNAKPFTEWLEGVDGNGKKNVSDIPKFCLDNYIPEKTDLNISNFDDFYQKRKTILVEQIHTILNIKMVEILEDIIEEQEPVDSIEINI